MAKKKRNGPHKAGGSPTKYMRLSTYEVISHLIDGEMTDSEISRHMNVSRQWIGEVKTKARNAGVFKSVKAQVREAVKKAKKK